jgi:phthalate 4,5-cis-dihydrodiol dehydrogenase
LVTKARPSRQSIDEQGRAERGTMAEHNTNNLTQLRFGILGLGRAGSAFVGPIQKHSGTTITAAAEPRADTLERFGRDHQVDLHSTPEELCSNPNVDVIYVATPTQMHTEHVLMAISHGKHVLVAKPFAIDMASAQTMLDAANRAGVRLVEAHPQTMDTPVLAMREIIESGEIGAVRMLHNWSYGAWLYQPRTPEELDTKLGGGATFRQGAHQFDILRLIAGGAVRSVRAMTGSWDPTRPTEGAHAAFLDFENGAAATAVFNGYDHFHTSELTYGLGQGGSIEKSTYGASRLARAESAPGADQELKQLRGYGQENSRPGEATDRGQPFYGLTLVTCEEGDIRQSPNGLLVYGKNEMREVPLGSGRSGRHAVLDEVYDAVVRDLPAVHDGEWSMATLEVTLGVLESGRTRSEVMMEKQASLKRAISTLGQPEQSATT